MEHNARDKSAANNHFTIAGHFYKDSVEGKRRKASVDDVGVQVSQGPGGDAVAGVNYVGYSAYETEKMQGVQSVKFSSINSQLYKIRMPFAANSFSVGFFARMTTSAATTNGTPFSQAFNKITGSNDSGNEKTRLEALTACSPGTLASIHSDQANDALKLEFNALSPDCDCMWLGGKDPDEHAYKSVDLFEWEDGSPFDYLTQFEMQNTVEPTTADYVAMWQGNSGTLGTTAGKWAAFVSDGSNKCKCWACMTANTNINLTYTKDGAGTIAMGMELKVGATTIPSSSPNKTVTGVEDDQWVYLTQIQNKTLTKISLQKDKTLVSSLD